MPQLNPAPWLMTLILSWMTLLILFNPKTVLAVPQNAPIAYSQEDQKTTPWNWPWA